MHQRGLYTSKWISTVEEWMNELGMTNIWLNQNVNIKWFKNAVKLRLEDQFRQKWFSDVYEHESCFNYRMYKDAFDFEMYLIDLPRDYANLWCKFRTSNQKLNFQ